MRVLNVVVKKVFVRVSFLHYVIQKCFVFIFVLFANHVKKTLSVLTVSPPPNAHPTCQLIHLHAEPRSPPAGALQQPVQNSNLFLLKDYYTDERGHTFHPLVS